MAPYRNVGKQILRGKEHFADAATPDIAEALVMILNGQVLMMPEVPMDRQEWLGRVLWP